MFCIFSGVAVGKHWDKLRTKFTRIDLDISLRKKITKQAKQFHDELLFLQRHTEHRNAEKVKPTPRMEDSDSGIDGSILYDKENASYEVQDESSLEYLMQDSPKKVLQPSLSSNCIHSSLKSSPPKKMLPYFTLEPIVPSFSLAAGLKQLVKVPIRKPYKPIALTGPRVMNTQTGKSCMQKYIPVQ